MWVVATEGSGNFLLQQLLIRHDKRLTRSFATASTYVLFFLEPVQADFFITHAHTQRKGREK